MGSSYHAVFCGLRAKVKQFIPHTEWIFSHARSVAGPLDKRFAAFLRNARGQRTFAEFARKLGLPPSTLHRLESGEQSATLGKVDQIMKRLRCSLADIFEHPGR
ncbi:MAG: helix-turn-helix domain-containing protein [Chthoniobacterales bacterium]